MPDAILSASVPITLDGREYLLRYRAHAFIQYADACGGDLLVELRKIGESLIAAGQAEGAGLAGACATIRDVLWAGLIDAQPDIRREDVGRLFGFTDVQVIVTAIGEAIRKTMPEAPPAGAAHPIKAVKRRPSSPLADGRDSGPSIATDPALPRPNSAI